MDEEDGQAGAGYPIFVSGDCAASPEFDEVARHVYQLDDFLLPPCSRIIHVMGISDDSMEMCYEARRGSGEHFVIRQQRLQIENRGVLEKCAALLHFLKPCDCCGRNTS